MVSVITLLVLFTTIGAVYSDSEGKWGYVNLASDDVKGPEEWHDLELKKPNHCGKKRQSPINIKISEVKEEDSYRRLKITFYNKRGLVTGTLENTGHSPKLKIADSNGASLTGGPLGNNKFELLEFRVHFGCVNKRGSEHKLNGKQLSGELHMVFGHDEKPRAVVAVWIKAPSKGNKIFGKLANLMHHIIKPEDTYPVTKEDGIYLKDLIPKKCSIGKGKDNGGNGNGNGCGNGNGNGYGNGYGNGNGNGYGNGYGNGNGNGNGNGYGNGNGNGYGNGYGNGNGNGYGNGNGNGYGNGYGNGNGNGNGYGKGNGNGYGKGNGNGYGNGNGNGYGNGNGNGYGNGNGNGNGYGKGNGKGYGKGNGNGYGKGNGNGYGKGNGNGYGNGNGNGNGNGYGNGNGNGNGYGNGNGKGYGNGNGNGNGYGNGYGNGNGNGGKDNGVSGKNYKKKKGDANRLTLKRYFTYRGSLTTPPCTQTIRWIVLKDYILASTSQLEKLRKLKAKYYGPHMCDNFRPVQKLNGRDVYSVTKKNNDK